MNAILRNNWKLVVCYSLMFFCICDQLCLSMGHGPRGVPANRILQGAEEIFVIHRGSYGDESSQADIKISLGGDMGSRPGGRTSCFLPHFLPMLRPGYRVSTTLLTAASFAANGASVVLII